MEATLTDLMNWVQLHPNWAGLFVLVVSALESFLVVGLIVPGSVVMFGLGTMVAAGSLELLPTLMWAALGALLGDGTSYFIGRHYHQRLRVMWPFRKYPDMMTRGVDFFHKHGGKSIFMARFVGPVRPLLPAVAGMLDMPAQRFFMFNTVSALLWSPAYILPGVLFGASLGVAAEIAGHLALLLVLLLALLWFSWWLMRRLTRSLQPHAQSIQLRVLDHSRRHRWLYPLAASLLDPQHPEARGMTLLTFLLVIASWLLLTLLPGESFADSWLRNLDLYLYHQLQNLRGPLGDRLLLFVAGFGSKWVLYGFTALMSAWLLWRRHWRMTLHWLIVVAAVGGMTWLLQYYTAVARPPVLNTVLPGLSFPSLHASLSIAVYGFLAVAIARELRSNWHWVPYSSALFLVVAISFSNLYLGAHWFSDILGGWSLGLAWVALMGIAYRQHPAEAISARAFATVALAALALAATLYTSQKFSRQLTLYKPRPAAEITLERADWLDRRWRTLPAYRDDFVGRHSHPLDIQWLASRKQIETFLRERGWQAPRTAGGLSLLDLFSSNTGLKDLPVLPQVHRGETQQILLVHTSDRPAAFLLTLRLWKTQYRLAGSGEPLWIGNISYLSVDERFRVVHFLHTDPDYRDALQEFIPSLAGAKYRRVQRGPEEVQPSTFQWSGNVLLIDGD
jgi:membrane protein DedA with SNARE-associated domain/membrane-associated phospholipid phosphatase